MAKSRSTFPSFLLNQKIGDEKDQIQISKGALQTHISLTIAIAKHTEIVDLAVYNLYIISLIQPLTFSTGQVNFSMSWDHYNKVRVTLPFALTYWDFTKYTVISSIVVYAWKHVCCSIKAIVNLCTTSTRVKLSIVYLPCAALGFWRFILTLMSCHPGWITMTKQHWVSVASGRTHHS